MRITKKIIAVVLSVLMAISMMPLSVFAATTGVANGAELKAAVAAAQDGDTIRFTNSFTMTATQVGFEVNKNITFDLNGQTISGPANGSVGKAVDPLNKTEVMFVTGDANVTFEDSAGGGSWTYTYSANSNAQLVDARDNSVITVNSGSYIANTANRGALVFCLRGNAKIIVNGGTISTVNGKLGDTCISAQSANNVVEINGGTLNTSKSSDTALGVSTCNTTVNDGEINGKISGKAGKTVLNDGTFKTYDGTANTAVSAYLPADQIVDSTTGQIKNVDASTVARTNSGEFTSLKDALDSVAAGATETITLLDDCTLSATYEITDNQKITIDLNGNDITTTARAFNIRHGQLTIKGTGNLNANFTGANAAVGVYGAATDSGSNYSTFTLTSPATINAPNGYGAMIGATSGAAYGAKLQLGGTINSKYGIYINGNVAEPATKTNAAAINITGTVTASNENAVVYAAGYAKTSIYSNANLTGGSGVYIKSGTLNISGNAAITATGAKTDYAFNNNGANGTGDAVIIDSCGYPGNIPTVAIKAGTITSANGAAVASYAKQDDPRYPDAEYPRVDNVIPATSTAVFSSDVSELAADGYETVRDDEKGGYVIAKDEHSVAKVNGVKYDTFEAALAAISTVTTATHSKATDPTYEYKTYVANGEITLLQDCTTNGIIIGSGSDLTIDFNGKTLDITAKPVGSNGTETIGMQLLKNSDITFKNGTLTSTADSSEKIVRLIQNYSDLTLDNMTVSMKGNFYDQMTISNCNGEITITDSTVSAPDFSWIGYDAEQSAESLRARAMSIGSFSSTAYPDVNVTITNSEINGYVNIDNSAEGATAELTLNNSTVNGNIVDKAMDGATVTNNKSTVSGIPENYEWVDNSDGTSSLVEKEPVAEDTAALAVGSKTELVFHINADAHNATKIVVSAPDNTKENNTAIDTEYTNVSGEDYVIRVALAPSQIKERINVAIYNGSTLVEEYNYSIYDYCFAAVEDADYPADAKNLVKAFVNYAAASQKAVEWNDSGDYAIDDDELYEVASATPSSVAQFAAIDGATLTSVSVVCRNETAVRFNYTGTVDSATISGIDGAEVTVYDNAILVTGIPANKIGTAFTLTINGTPITYSVDSWNAAALNYFAAGTVNNTLATALATYGAMAEAYFG